MLKSTIIGILILSFSFPAFGREKIYNDGVYKFIKFAKEFVSYSGDTTDRIHDEFENGQRQYGKSYLLDSLSNAVTEVSSLLTGIMYMLSLERKHRQEGQISQDATKVLKIYIQDVALPRIQVLITQCDTIAEGSIDDFVKKESARASKYIYNIHEYLRMLIQELS